ncbi:fimbrial protein [Yokenella regensburgei]|uniref:fimbrial protein n=1 Tax=Yokenella regensburgei TaxID=158877 RepID=UPI0031DAC2AC
MIFARWGAIALFAMTGILLAGDTAAAGSSNLDVRITGTVVATASCTFSGTDPIKVEFGDVYINEIIGEAYKQPVPYQVSCKGDPDGKTLQMQIAGSAASFDGKQLKTDASGLGIKLLKGSETLSVNQWFNFDNASQPLLYAVLEKQTGARFQDGQAFNASATLKVAYN